MNELLSSEVLLENPDAPNNYFVLNDTDIHFTWTIMGTTYKAPKREMLRFDISNGTSNIVLLPIWPNLENVDWVLGAAIFYNICLSLNYDENTVGISESNRVNND